MKTLKYASIIIFIILMLSGCSKNSDPWKHATMGSSLEDVIKKGLEDEDIDKENLLHMKEVNDKKIILFTRNNAIGIATVTKRNEKWYWIRKNAFIGFETNDPSDYMAGGFDIKTLNNRTYFIAMGKIFNPKIKKITINHDSVQAIIRSHKDTTYWFAVLNNETSFTDIKAYDNQGHIVSDNS